MLALTVGLLLVAIAAGSLWLTFGGSLSWQLVRVLVPLVLVVVGVLGVLLSRHRT